MKSYIEELLGTLGANMQGTSYSDLASITPEQIAEGLAGQYGIDPEMLPSSLFTSLTQGILSSTYGKTYSPLMQAKQNPLLQDLLNQFSGKKSRQASGNFAGSGQYQDFTASAKDIYGRGMTDVMTDISSSIGAGEQSIIDWINSMRETALGIRYGDGQV